MVVLVFQLSDHFHALTAPISCVATCRICSLNAQAFKGIFIRYLSKLSQSTFTPLEKRIHYKEYILSNRESLVMNARQADPSTHLYKANWHKVNAQGSLVHTHRLNDEDDDDDTEMKLMRERRKRRRSLTSCNEGDTFTVTSTTAAIDLLTAAAIANDTLVRNY